MRTPALLVHICVCLLPVCGGQWYNDVVSSGDTCETKYHFNSCLDSFECVSLFMDCHCIPQEVKADLNGDPTDGQTVCLIADLLLSLGQPSCCMAKKRDLFSNFIPSIRNGDGQESTADYTSSNTITPADKRASDLIAQTKKLEKSVELLLKSEIDRLNPKETEKSQPVQPYDKDKDVLQNKIYRYLREYLRRKPTPN